MLFFLHLSVRSAQTAEPPPLNPSLKPVTVSERSAALQADILGITDIPLARSPFAATVVDSQTIEEIGALRLSDLFRLDASLSDAYNAVGYWDFVTIRGFVIDQTYNYRRDGLPISAETSIPLENKERVEFLKGTSGILAGTSAPGGMVNYVVKRPTASTLRMLRLETTNDGGLLGHLDLGGRFGDENRFGYRLNAVAADIQSYVPDANGNRQLLALAMDWRVSRDTLLEGEFEYSRLRQPSVPGLSLLGNALPPADPTSTSTASPGHSPISWTTSPAVWASSKPSTASGAGKDNWARSVSRVMTAWPTPSAAMTPDRVPTMPTASARTATSTCTTTAATTSAARRSPRWSRSSVMSSPGRYATTCRSGCRAPVTRRLANPRPTTTRL